MSDSRNTLLFSVGKKELFTPSNGLKSLQRKLRTSWKISTFKEAVSKDVLKQGAVAVFAGPREKFTGQEMEALRQHILSGGNVLVMLGEGGETKFETNINYLLEQFGIIVNNDCVVRTSYYKYHHPKECLVSNGILNREFNKQAGKHVSASATSGDEGDAITYLYPYGATLSVQKPAVPVLSTGAVALPLNRPTCAFFTDKGAGKLAVVGSAHMFSDQYIDKEENAKLLNIIMDWLTTDAVQLNQIDAEEPDVSEYNYVPDTSKMADQLRVCLQEGDEVPRDFTTLFSKDLFQLDTTAIPETVRAFEELGVKHEKLSLIEPQFETPLPPLQPAVFPPNFSELDPPALELFDLDEEFSSERVRLNQLTNKCNDDDLEYFIWKSGEILGVSARLEPEKRDAKHILEYIFRQVVEFKKMNQD